MSQPFSFPPPPPPPPQKPPQNSYQHVQPGNSRGIHSTSSVYNNNPSFRGRGPPRGRGQPRASNHYGRGTYRYTSGPSNHRNTVESSHLQTSNQELTHSGTGRGQKRNSDSAFSNHNAQLRAPVAPPAVPGFGHDLEALMLQKKPRTDDSVEVKKTNILGLTPAPQEDSEAEDEDADEEAKHAHAHANALQFEYRGNTSTLSTPEEIAAWITERRKRWPTEAKRDAAKQEADEKRKKWLEEKAIRAENASKAAQQRREERVKQRTEREKTQLRQKMLRDQINKAKSPAVPAQQDEKLSPAQIKAERLRKKAAKIAAQLQKAEKALEGDTAAQPDDTIVKSNDRLEEQSDHDLEQMLACVDEAAQKHAEDLSLTDLDTSSDSDGNVSDSLGDAEATSTSGSSSEDEGDSDAPPEVSSSRQPIPALETGPSRDNAKKQQQAQRFCPNLAKSGRCRFGKKCRYSHVREGGRKGSSNPERRKGLYQAMVEKEQEDERKRAVQMIIAMGNSGVFDDVLNS